MLQCATVFLTALNFGMYTWPKCWLEPVYVNRSRTGDWWRWVRLREATGVCPHNARGWGCWQARAHSRPWFRCPSPAQNWHPKLVDSLTGRAENFWEGNRKHKQNSQQPEASAIQLLHHKNRPPVPISAFDPCCSAFPRCIHSAVPLLRRKACWPLTGWPDAGRESQAWSRACLVSPLNFNRHWPWDR
jgi:hypothetical protein